MRQTGGCIYFRHLTSHFAYARPLLQYFSSLTKLASRYLCRYKQNGKSWPAVPVTSPRFRIFRPQLLHVKRLVPFCFVDKVLTSQSSNNSPGGILIQLTQTINVTQRKRVERTCKQILHKVKWLIARQTSQNGSDLLRGRVEVSRFKSFSCGFCFERYFWKRNYRTPNITHTNNNSWSTQYHILMTTKKTSLLFGLKTHAPRLQIVSNVKNIKATCFVLGFVFLVKQKSN